MRIEYCHSSAGLSVILINSYMLLYSMLILAKYYHCTAASSKWTTKTVSLCASQELKITSQVIGVYSHLVQKCLFMAHAPPSHTPVAGTGLLRCS